MPHAIRPAPAATARPPRRRVPLRLVALMLLAGGVTALGGSACAEQDAQVRSTKRATSGWAWNPQPAHPLSELISPTDPGSAPARAPRTAAAPPTPPAAGARATAGAPSGGPGTLTFNGGGAQTGLAPELAEALNGSRKMTVKPMLAPPTAAHAQPTASASKPATTTVALPAPSPTPPTTQAAAPTTTQPTDAEPAPTAPAVAATTQPVPVPTQPQAVAPTPSSSAAPTHAAATPDATPPAAAPQPEPDPIVIIVPTARPEPAETAKADISKPNTAKPEPAKPDPAKAEPKPDHAKPVAAAPEPGHDTTPPAPTAEAGDARFEAPGMTAAQRKAFGFAAAGPGPGAAPPAQDARDSGTMVKVFGAAAAAGAVGTAVLVVLLGFTTDAAGRRRWGFTLGSKLALGFGWLTTLLLVLALTAAIAQRNVAMATADVRHLADDAQRLGRFETALGEMRLTAHAFCAAPTDANLDAFTAAAGAARSNLQACSVALQSSPHAGTVQKLMEALGAFEATFRDAVAAIDERRAVVHSQIDPGVDRTLALLDAAAQRAEGARDTKSVANIGVVRAAVLKARLALGACVDADDPADAEAATTLAQAAAAEATGLVARMEHRPGYPWALAAADGVAFIADRARHAAGLGAKIADVTAKMTARSGPAVAAVNENLQRTLADSRAAAVARADAERAGAATFMGSLAGAAVLLGALTGGWVVRSVRARSRDLAAAVRCVADNDLSGRPINSTAKDELGDLARAVDAMVAGLRDAVTEVTISTTEVASTAAQVAGSVPRSSTAGEALAAPCAAAASAAETTARAAAEAVEAARRAAEGVRAVGDCVQNATEAVAGVGERGAEVGRSLALIGEIAERTSLLALNAAIEAARAGDNGGGGRGFAAVADQVRELAERTAKATEQVHAGVRAMQEETRRACERMNESAELVRQGLRLADDAGTTADRTAQTASGLAGTVRTIGEAAERAATAPVTSAAAGQLSAKAEHLTAVVARFNLGAGSVEKLAEKHASAASVVTQTAPAPATPVAAASTPPAVATAVAEAAPRVAAAPVSVVSMASAPAPAAAPRTPRVPTAPAATLTSPAPSGAPIPPTPGSLYRKPAHCA